MEENKNLENEIEETVEEAVEETAEAVEEAVEAVEEAVEETAKAAEEASEGVEYAAEETFEPVAETIGVFEEPIEEPKKVSKKGIIIATIVAVVIIAAAVVTSLIDFNPYNRLGYVDISGKTIQDIADAQGVSLEEFLENYKLPKDMPGNTTEAAAYYTIPAGIIAKMNGLDFETLKTVLKLPENATEDTPWGEAEGGISVADYIGGEDKLPAFKEKYGLGDDVTGSTTWAEIRHQVDLVTKKEREEKEAANEGAEETSQEAQEEAPQEEAAE